MIAYLALKDGTVFKGKSIGLVGKASGEVVFNTSMTGYQEMLTDPSYEGQMIVMTYPMVGNYGTNHKDVQSSRCHAKGLMVTELCGQPSNYRAEKKLHTYLVENGVVGMKGVDTRSLTLHIRTWGTMPGIIACEADPSALAEEAKALPAFGGPELVRSVTTERAYEAGNGPRTVSLFDFGVKANVIDSLVNLGLKVRVLPAWATAEEALEGDVVGVVLSNGPGDPNDASYALGPIRRILETGMPVMGICLGHQLLGLATGAGAVRMKFGHRGANHPVRDVETNRCYITSQNHGYALDPEGLWDDWKITHYNLHDGTVEGMRHKRLPAFSVQFHPEAFPGPGDTSHIFERFMSIVDERGGIYAKR
ncbi:MAG TPA: glutamine-hydrolyzing carbamoyl-phosphate synthase small subunit [Bacillota bacterium]|nr:glutamine-hydrolyzing carbamoyl-phosphate synthase small subunit [Bacillota bacterium]HPU95769.1 glutamine-hydrolyzing carbamoyl-phosphate synthase small subunit [Bacillota bacterium]